MIFEPQSRFPFLFFFLDCHSSFPFLSFPFFSFPFLLFPFLSFPVFVFMPLVLPSSPPSNPQTRPPPPNQNPPTRLHGTPRLGTRAPSRAEPSGVESFERRRCPRPRRPWPSSGPWSCCTASPGHWTSSWRRNASCAAAHLARLASSCFSFLLGGQNKRHPGLRLWGCFFGWAWLRFCECNPKVSLSLGRA